MDNNDPHTFKDIQLDQPNPPNVHMSSHELNQKLEKLELKFYTLSLTVSKLSNQVDLLQRERLEKQRAEEEERQEQERKKNTPITQHIYDNVKYPVNYICETMSFYKKKYSNAETSNNSNDEFYRLDDN